jgi:hypothetical protein
MDLPRDAHEWLTVAAAALHIEPQWSRQPHGGLIRRIGLCGTGPTVSIVQPGAIG